MEKINRCNIEEEGHMFLVNKFICTIKLQIVINSESICFAFYLVNRGFQSTLKDVHLLSNFNVQLNQRLYCGRKASGIKD